MLDCVRHALAILIGTAWLILCGVVLIDTQLALPKVDQQGTEQHDITKPEPNARDTINAAIYGSPSPSQETKSPDERAEHQNRESAMSETVLGWSPTAWIALLTVALTVIAIVQVCVYAVQAGYMRQGLAKTAASIELARLEQRAWLTVDIQPPVWVHKSDISGDETGICEMTIGNSGLTPASNISIKFNDNVDGARFLEFLPSKLAIGNSRVEIPVPDLAPRAQHRTDQVVNKDGKSLPFVSGVINYRHTGDTATGETWFCAQFADERTIFKKGENRIR